MTRGLIFTGWTLAAFAAEHSGLVVAPVAAALIVLVGGTATESALNWVQRLLADRSGELRA